MWISGAASKRNARPYKFPPPLSPPGGTTVRRTAPGACGGVSHSRREEERTSARERRCSFGGRSSPNEHRSSGVKPAPVTWTRSQFKKNYVTEMSNGSEEGSYARLIDVCIT